MSNQGQAPFVLLYDNDCGLCNALVNFISRKDTGKKARYITLQSGEGQYYLKKVSLPINYCSSVVYIKGEHSYIKSTAILTLLNDIGGWLKLVNFFIVLPLPFRDFIYDTVARYRHLLFKNQKKCKLPATNQHKPIG